MGEKKILNLHARDFKAETRAAHAGLDPHANSGIVNPPVYHASTVLFENLDALADADRNPFTVVNYGRIGTPTSHAFESAVAELEGGYRAITAASGLAAITTALFAVTRAGDHLLITDSVYAPTRRFCNETLAGYGIEVEYFPPTLDADGLKARIKPNTVALYLESPGSLTFEIQDVPALSAVAKAAGLTVLLDNTWATPLYFKPFRHGVDVSIHAATKYLVGHSDAMLGVMVARDAETYQTFKKAAVRFGTCGGPDDVYLALRGIRTLGVRLRRHQETAVQLAIWLSHRPEVARVLHPALASDPGHALWRRDFTGSSGLFAMELHPCSRPALAAMVDGMSLFGIGYSWGGYESLILPTDPRSVRTAAAWNTAGPLVRLHAGLEDPDDLIADLDAGFARLAAVQHAS